MTENLFLGMVITSFATIVGSLGALSFKFASNHINKNIFSLLKRPIFYVGVLCYGIASMIYIVALRFGDLSALYPIAGLSYVWVSLLSMRFLNEKMNGYKWLGISFILLAIIFIGIGS